MFMDLSLIHIWIGTSASAGKEEAKLRFEDYVNDVTGWIDYLGRRIRGSVQQYGQRP